jgi:hypothetical protein
MNTKELAAQVAKALHLMKKGTLDPQFKKALDEELGQFEDPISDWEQPGQIDKVPSKETIVMGPVEAASGAGASRMVEQYSAFAPQGGITLLYEQFSRMMAPMSREIDAVKSDINVIKTSLFSLVKADGKEGKRDGDEEDEKTEMVEKARKTMKKARVIIVKAEDADGEDEGGMEDEVDEDLNKAQRLLKTTQEFLNKAEEARKDDGDEDDEEIEKARGLRKSLVKRLSAIKASVDLIKSTKAAASAAAIKAKEDEEEETAKAQGNDKGNQADSQNPENGNQDDASAKSDVGMLTKSVNEMMEFLMASASGSRVNPAPVMAKSQQDHMESIDAALDDAVDDNEITEDQAIEGRTILRRLEAVKCGTLDKSVVLGMIAKADPKVQSIFSRVA